MKATKKGGVVPLVALVLVCGLAVVGCDNGYGIEETVEEGLSYVSANPKQGFNYGYYYYIPQSVGAGSTTYLLVEPNNTGRTSNDIKVHDDEARNLINMRAKGYAAALDCILLVPFFPRPASNGNMYTHALDRVTLKNKTGKMARLDVQMIRMIDDVTERSRSKGIDLKPKVLMDGFSASGTFVNRFTAIHPGLVQAVASGGINCIPILPSDSLKGKRLIYPVGIADLEKITGSAFDLPLYKTVPQYIYMGSEDNNDTLSGNASYSEKERQLIIRVLGRDMHGRWEPSKRVYEDQGCSAVKFVIYNAIDHRVTNSMAQDVIAFFKSNMK
jgi:hypothetical protein